MFASRANTEKRDLLERRGFASGAHGAADADRPGRDRSVEEPDAARRHRLRPLEPDDLDAVRDDDGSRRSQGTAASRRAGSTSGSTSRLRHPAFDPSLWRVARVDGEVVGAILVYDVGDTGYLEQRRGPGGVAGQGHRRPRSCGPRFAALRDRGQMRVVVSLDADAAPAAVHLYEAAGMRVHERHDWFVKTDLLTDRPGRSLRLRAPVGDRCCTVLPGVTRRSVVATARYDSRRS